MSRLKRVADSVASGYVVLGVTAIYALASLPLALHYLSKERFGLWGLMASISGHLSLIDAGMSGWVARLLIDYKDQREGGTYGSLIKTGWLVLLVQGLIICSVGFGLAPLLCNLEDIQPQLRTEFIQLLRWQSIALAVQFCTRIFGHILQAHQRIDLINYSQVFTLVLNFTLLYILLLRQRRVQPRLGHTAQLPGWRGFVLNLLPAAAPVSAGACMGKSIVETVPGNL